MLQHKIMVQEKLVNDFKFSTECNEPKCKTVHNSTQLTKYNPYYNY